MCLTNEFNEPSLKLFRAARFGYRVGSPIMSDGEYDILERQIIKTYPDAEEVHQTYDSDKINIPELLEYGFDLITLEAYARNRKYTYNFLHDMTNALMQEDNTSILSMKTDEEVHKSFQSHGYGKYRISPKIDGLFTSLIYEREEDTPDTYWLAVALTRGDENNRLDITTAMSNIVPQRIVIQDEPESIRISGESIFDARHLDKTEYVTQRSACQGVLASVVNPKPGLQPYINFYAHGSVMTSSYQDALAKIKDAGIPTVPTFEFEYNGEDLENLLFLIQPCINKVIKWGEETQNEVDGAVVTKVSENTGEILTKGNKMYRSGVFAIKTGFWNKGFYESKVIGIIAEQQDARVSYKLDIEPVTASNGCSLTKVTDLNLSTLIKDSIRIGDKVAFNYLNSTTIKYLYKVVEE